MHIYSSFKTLTISFGATLSALKVKQAQAKAVLALRAERCQQIAIVAIAFGLSLEKGDNNTHRPTERRRRPKADP